MDNNENNDFQQINDENEYAEQRRQHRDEVRKQREEEQQEKKKNIKGTIVVFGLILIGIYFFHYALTNTMPEMFMKKGEEHLKNGNYIEAYKMFDKVSNSKPYDTEPVYKKAVALSKLPPNYENQKALYEISELEDHDKASEYARKVLEKMRNEIDKQIGQNYASNTAYDGIVFRWNTSRPITYYISSKQSQKINADTVRKSFKDWSVVSNNKIFFEEISNNDAADISVYLTDGAITESKDFNAAGYTNPIIKDTDLQKVEITLKTGNNKKHFYDINKFETLAKHHIGHALGIWGHSADEFDLMFHKNEYIDNIKPNQTITKRDANTLNLLYNIVPDAINKPLTKEEKSKLLYTNIVKDFPGVDYQLEVQRLMADIKANPQNIVNWVDLAIKHGLNHSYERSNTILNRALSLTNNDIHNHFVVLYNLAANYYKLKQYDYAEQFLKMATMFNEDIETQILEAFIDLKKGKIELGKGKLEALHKMYPENIEIALKLTNIYYNEKNKEKAKEVIEKLVEVNPKSKLDRRVMKYYTYNLNTSNAIKKKDAK